MHTEASGPVIGTSRGLGVVPRPVVTGPWDELLELESEPTLGAELITLLGQHDPSVVEAAELVQLDPALTLKVIRLANAPQFRGRYEIVSAHDAVCRLGVDLVRTLVVMTSLGVDERLPRSYWSETAFTACAASIAARKLRVPEGDALSAGLLCDIGRALLWQRHTDRYAQVVAHATGGVSELLTAEQVAFGATHGAIGAMALERLDLPTRLVDAVHQHHHDVAAVSPLARACQLGAMACDYHRRRSISRRRSAPWSEPSLARGAPVGVDPDDDVAAIADAIDRFPATTDALLDVFHVGPS